MIDKLVQYAPPKITHNIVDALSKACDPIIVLEYIDALTFSGAYRTSQERNAMHHLRLDLSRRLNLVVSSSHPEAFLVESFQIDKSSFIANAHPHFAVLRDLRAGDPVVVARRVIHASACDPALFRVFVVSVFIANRAFSEFLVQELRSQLQSLRHASPLEIRPFDFFLSTAQAYLGRLYLIGFGDLAGPLLADVLSIIATETAPLHWLASFLVRHRALLPPDMIDLIKQTVATLPLSGDLFVTDGDVIATVANALADRVSPLLQDPDVLVAEYPSPFDHALAFAQCSLAVLPVDDRSLGELLSAPIFDYRRASRHRALSCCCLAKLAAAMGADTGFAYFTSLFDNRGSEVGLEAGRIFLADCRLELFNMICGNTKSILAESHTKLEYFMRMVVPSYQRLDGDVETAGKCLSGLLETVTKATPRKLQEAVVDVVGFVYARLRLGEVRHILIAAAAGADTDLRATLPLCLELGVTEIGTAKPGLAVGR
jgi:hypothetical protein